MLLALKRASIRSVACNDSLTKACRVPDHLITAYSGSYTILAGFGLIIGGVVCRCSETGGNPKVGNLLKYHQNQLSQYGDRRQMKELIGEVVAENGQI